jgi:hypothetical protein
MRLSSDELAATPHCCNLVCGPLQGVHRNHPDAVTVTLSYQIHATLQDHKTYIDSQLLTIKELGSRLTVRQMRFAIRFLTFTRRYKTTIRADNKVSCCRSSIDPRFTISLDWIESANAKGDNRRSSLGTCNKRSMGESRTACRHP